MDDRTYDAIADHMSLLQQAEAENARLTHELDLRIRQLMDVSRNYSQLLTANEELRDNAAELGKALDMALWHSRGRVHGEYPSRGMQVDNRIGYIEVHLPSNIHCNEERNIE